MGNMYNPGVNPNAMMGQQGGSNYAPQPRQDSGPQTSPIDLMLLSQLAMSAPRRGAPDGTGSGTSGGLGVDGGLGAGSLGGPGYQMPSHSGYGGRNGLPDWITDPNLQYGQSYGSLGGLWAAENGGMLGRVAGLASGIPGLGTLGGWWGNQYIDNNVFANRSFARTPTDDMLDSYLYGTAAQSSPWLGDTSGGGPSYGPGMRPVQSGRSSGSANLPGGIKWRKRK